MATETSSTRPLLSMLQFSAPPPSRRIFRIPSFLRIWRRIFTDTSRPSPQTKTLTPLRSRLSILFFGALDVTATIVGTSLAVLTTYDVSGVCALLSTMILLGLRSFANFTVSCGLSLTNVLIPTIIPSTQSLKRWTLLRSAGDDIREWPVCGGVFPSRLISALGLTEWWELRLA